MPLELVLDPGAARWTVTGPSPEVSPHEVDNPLLDTVLRDQLLALRGLASQPIAPGTPEGDTAELALDSLARTLGARLTDVLLSPVVREKVRAALATHTRGRPLLVVRGRVSAEPGESPAVALQRADSALALPWELLMPEPGEFAVRAAKLDVAREALVEGADGVGEPDEQLAIAVSISAPEDQSTLRYEEEAWRLLGSLHGHRVEFTDLGGLDDLLALVDGDLKLTALHFSGHGLPGALAFENAYGEAHIVPVGALIEKLRVRLTRPGASQRFPRLFYLASCHGSNTATGVRDGDGGFRDPKLVDDAALGHGPSTAASLHRGGFAQVVGYLGPVGDQLSTRAEEALYRELARGESTIQAVARARDAMGEDTEVEGLRKRHPLAWAQLVLYHRGDDQPLVRATRRPTSATRPFRRKEVALQNLPVLEAGFIGRRALLHEVRRRVQRDGSNLVVIQGLGGLGKTALASRLLTTVLAHDPGDVLVLTCRELADDPLGTLCLQVEDHGRQQGVEGWEATLARIKERTTEPAARFEAMVRALREVRPTLVVYADNAETLQVGPDDDRPESMGAWREDAKPWWQAMERLSKGGLVMLTTRYAWPGLSPEALLPIGRMAESDTFKMVRTWEHLGALPESVQRRLSRLADGLPRTIQLLDALVDEHMTRERLRLDELVDPWAQLIAPLLPENVRRINANLLLDRLWHGLDAEARRLASIVALLRRAAPEAVLRALGGDREVVDTLRRRSLLTRVQQPTNNERGERAWQDRWSMHPVVATHVRAQSGGVAERDAHLAIGRAYAEQTRRSGAIWADNVEAVAHLHAAGEANEAWPLAREHVLFLRRGADYRGAELVLTQCEAAGIGGDPRAELLVLQAQMRQNQGDFAQSVGERLDRALECAIEARTRAAVLHEMGALSHKRGRFAEAEESLQRALEIRKDTIGEKHPDYAASLHALAGAQRAQGRFAEAERSLLRALEIEKDTIGEKHPDYAASLHSLAGAQQAQGRFAEAERSLLRALEIEKDTIGEKHPSYATSLHALAVAQHAQGRFAEAERSLLRALEIKKETIGEKHPSYAASLHALAVAQHAQGRFAEAERSLRRSLLIDESTHGLHHPTLGPTLITLAAVLAEQARAGEAESLAQRAVAILERVHGELHPEVGQTLNLLAQLQAVLGRAEAAATARRSLRILEATLGAEHPTVCAVRPRLTQIASGVAAARGAAEAPTAFDARLQAAIELVKSRRLDEARQALTALAEDAVRARAPGPEASARSLLAQVLLAQNEHDAAATEARRALEIAESLDNAEAARNFRTLLAQIDAARPGAPTALRQQRLSRAVEKAKAHDWTGALVDSQQVIDEGRAAQDTDAVLAGHLVHAQVVAAIGQPLVARAELQQALALAREAGDQAWITAVQQLLASLPRE